MTQETEHSIVLYPISETDRILNILDALPISAENLREPDVRPKVPGRLIFREPEIRLFYDTNNNCKVKWFILGEKDELLIFVFVDNEENLKDRVIKDLRTLVPPAKI